MALRAPFGPRREFRVSFLVLDTAAEDGAAGLYERIGYQRAGIIPGYALKPHGGLCATIIYYKAIGPAARKE